MTTKIVLVLFGLLFALSFGEIGARAIKAYIDTSKELPAMYVDDDIVGWKLKPNFEGKLSTDEFETEIKTNSEGFRGQEFKYEENKEEQYTIVGLGDSFTFGYGVKEDEVFLNKIITEDKKVNVFNLGVPGYSTREEALMLEKYIEKIKPDLVILGFDVNDHVDCDSSELKYKVRDGYLINKNSNSVSLLYSFIVNALETVGKSNNSKEAVEKGWECSVEYLNKIRNLAASNNAEFVVIYIPHRSQVHEGLIQDEKVIKSYFQDLNTRLEAYGVQENVIYLDLLPAFRERASEDEPLYYITSDAHWNSKGHEVAASEISIFIKEKNNNKENEN